ncbi:hypothetical protein ACFYUK_21305 [Nonomuraea wenchangensis]
MALHIPWDKVDDYADDDLMVGAADPFQLFRIMYEVIRQDPGPDPAAYAGSGYFEKVAAERVGGEQAGWGA